jgi:hypothetical protein
LSEAGFAGGATAVFYCGFYFYGTAFALDPFPAGTAGSLLPGLLLLSGFLIAFDPFAISFFARGGGGATTTDFLAAPFTGSGGFFASSTFFLAAGTAVFFCGYILPITCVLKN